MREEESIVPYRSSPGRTATRAWRPGAQHSPPEISAMILQKLKAHAEAYLKVDSAVMRPAPVQRRPAPATRTGRSRAWTSSASSTSPPRASLAYGPGQGTARRSSSSTSAAHLDVPAWRSATRLFEVKSTAGDNHLGGGTTSTRRSSTGRGGLQARPGHRQLSARPMALQRSTRPPSRPRSSSPPPRRRRWPAVHHPAPRPQALDLRLTRAKLSELTSRLIDRVVAPVRQALDTTQGQGRQGSRPRGARRRHDTMPAVQEKVEELTGQEAAAA